MADQTHPHAPAFELPPELRQRIAEQSRQHAEAWSKTFELALSNLSDGSEAEAVALRLAKAPIPRHRWPGIVRQFRRRFPRT